MSSFSLPQTSPDHYISFKQALNLRYPQEDTGDWHFLSTFFPTNGRNRSATLAGTGCDVDTTPSLGTYGVREMSAIMVRQGIIEHGDEVYVANHYRAIADYVLFELHNNHAPMIACVRTINQWLDTEEQINTLRQDYLKPLRIQLNGEKQLSIFDQWIETVIYE